MGMHLCCVWIPAEHLSMAPGHSQALGGAGWWGRGERGLSFEADWCSTQPALYWGEEEETNQLWRSWGSKQGCSFWFKSCSSHKMSLKLRSKWKLMGKAQCFCNFLLQFISSPPSWAVGFGEEILKFLFFKGFFFFFLQLTSFLKTFACHLNLVNLTHWAPTRPNNMLKYQPNVHPSMSR